MVLGRWPHPSPWWGEELWPRVISGLPVLVVIVIIEGILDHRRKDHR